MARSIESNSKFGLEFLKSVRSGFPSWATRLGPDHIVDLSVLGQLSETSLTRDVEIVVPDKVSRTLLFLVAICSL